MLERHFNKLNGLFKDCLKQKQPFPDVFQNIDVLKNLTTSIGKQMH